MMGKYDDMSVLTHFPSFIIIWSKTHGHYNSRAQCLTGIRVCLHGGGGAQIGEVKCGGSPHLSCKRDQLKTSDYMDRRVTPPKRITSPNWGPPPPCKQPLIQPVPGSKIVMCRDREYRCEKKSQTTCALFSRRPYRLRQCFNPFTARVLDGDFKVTLTIESVDEIL